MNIPLDRLYQFIENIAETIYGDRVIIYRFFPHGSKNIQDLNQIRQQNWFEDNTRPNVWCHDQEPLNHEYYQQHLRQRDNGEFSQVMERLVGKNPVKNLNYNNNIFSKGLLVHSEQRSDEIEKYHSEGELIPVYYWSHAVIARDWFRYAQHVVQHKQVTKKFLIYSRAWSNTREYRLRFAELLILTDLQDHCKTTVNPIEPELGIHYNLHQFRNTTWRPQTILENYFTTSNASSTYSADFDLEDYESTDIEVVLETLFDDNRLHLTEKSLRPIACAQPFILVGTHGSLEYLRSYGFKTFGAVWDESYDQIEDPEQRMIAIADLMKQLNNCPAEIWAEKITQARAIADYNRQWFFSQDFFNLVVDELKQNLTTAFDLLRVLPASQTWINIANAMLTSDEIKQFLDRMDPAIGLTIKNITQALIRSEQLGSQ